MSKRAALYIRVSSDEQARHGLSLGEQRSDLINYAQEHGYTIVGIYADEGVTARKSISRRKELQRLLADVEKGLIDIIVIKCLDRWFRNIADFYKVKEKLDAHGVDWECTREQYNTTTPNGLLMLNLKLSIAQNESDQTSERIKYVFEGKKQRREVLTGCLPLGFKSENGHYAPDENMPAVQYLFQYVSDGGSMRSAQAAVYQKFGLALSYFQTRNTLANRIYIGERYGIPDYMPPAIPHDVFAHVQDILSRNSKPTRSGRIYLFSGLVRCPDCGHKLTACKGRTNAQGENTSYEYRCRNHYYQRPKNSNIGCTFSRSVYENKIEKYLLDNLQRLIQEHILTIEKQRIEQAKDSPAEKIKALKAKLSRLEDIFLDGLIDKDKYATTYKSISQEISALSLLIDHTPAIPAAICEVANDEDFLQTYQALSRENKQRFWKSIIASITYDDTPETRGTGTFIPFKITFCS